MRFFDGLGVETPEEDLAGLKQLRDALLEHVRPLKVVEIGSWAGRTAKALVDGLSPEEIQLWCVDHWQGSASDESGDLAAFHGHRGVLGAFCANLKDELHRTVHPCVGSSLFWASFWPFPVDLIFIDAEHTYEAVCTDITFWRKHLVPGGILCGHDYGIFAGVNRAVDELVPGAERLGRTLWWKQMMPETKQ